MTENQINTPKGSILVVDDRLENLQILMTMLSKRGYEVRPARSGAQALSAARSKKPDLILLDIIMPFMSGYEVCEYLKADEQTRDIPIIFVSASDETFDKLKAFSIGGIDYITKPFQAAEVLVRIETHLNFRDLQKRLVEKNELLEQEVVVRKRAEEAAKVANQAKSTFLANMSHELRTPLNSILGYAQILKRDELTEKQYDRLNIIEESGNHLLTLINDILDLSKIEAGKLEIYPAPLLLSHFLERVVSIIRNRAQQKDIYLIYEADKNLPTGIEADEKRLRQILLNLLGNAIKFTDAGLVTLRASLLNSLADGKVSIRFEVQDTGIGMTPEQLDKVFIPFEQVGDTQRYIEGTGLGLAITSQLVGLMGGEIQVKSEAGIGSTFWFEASFPTLTTGKEVKSSIEQSEIIGYQGSRRTLLVIDDNTNNRKFLFTLLESLGFVVHLAINGQEGVNRAKEVQPDLILTDLVMPVMDGFKAVQIIRDSQALKEIPIIAISASVFTKDKAKTQHFGFNAFLPKPMETSQLFKELEKLMSLTWIYATPKEIRQPTLEESLELQPFIPPPPAELEILYELAMLGRMRHIREWAARIETLDEQYLPLVSRVKKLAKVYETKQIAELAKQLMEDEP